MNLRGVQALHNQESRTGTERKISVSRQAVSCCLSSSVDPSCCSRNPSSWIQLVNYVQSGSDLRWTLELLYQETACKSRRELCQTKNRPEPSSTTYQVNETCIYRTSRARRKSKRRLNHARISTCYGHIKTWAALTRALRKSWTGNLLCSCITIREFRTITLCSVPVRIQSFTMGI